MSKTELEALLVKCTRCKKTQCPNDCPIFKKLTEGEG